MRNLFVRHRPIVLFAVAGVFGYLIDFISTLLFTPILGKYIARIPAFIFAATFTWIFNREFTFKGKPANKGVFREWIHYMSLMLGGLIVNYIVYVITISLMPESMLATAIAVAMGSLSGMVVNFLSSSRFLYK